MIITASASHTPLAFTGKTAARDDAPSIAAGFGAAPLQQVEAIDRKVLELLAKAAGDSTSIAAEAISRLRMAVSSSVCAGAASAAAPRGLAL